jgi:hypothetical protein
VQDREEFTVEEFFELVWQYPMAQLAKRFEVSDTALKNSCREVGITTPKRGHWVKVSAGKPVEKPDLNIPIAKRQELFPLPGGYCEFTERQKRAKQQRRRVMEYLPEPLFDMRLADAHPIIGEWLAKRELGMWGYPERGDLIPDKLEKFRLLGNSTLLKALDDMGASTLKTFPDGRFVVRYGLAKLRLGFRQKMSAKQQHGIDLTRWTLWPNLYGDRHFPTSDYKLTIVGDCVSKRERTFSEEEVRNGGLKWLLASVHASKEEAVIRRFEDIERRKREDKECEDRRKREEQLAEIERVRQEGEENLERLMQFADRWYRDEKINKLIKVEDQKLNKICDGEEEWDELRRLVDWAKQRASMRRSF